eukprot:TRINITY_DN1821_c0_g1_i2.p1 TRINITY_DN1821_c0_g1~~TRINITY_DN1821_c0_g1_i2.p1  ORF type:complete len:152 (+),score=50.97 TRINITY_DN1821_c0_g1_i2:59-514(+)
MSARICSRISRVAQRAQSIRPLSSSSLPHNIEELCCSQTKEVALLQANRVFGSGFLAHQGAISEIQGTEQVDPMDMMEQVTKGLDTRMEFYQQINVTMDMQTNVPEPFQAEDETEDSLKEGLPAGLSDSQVNLEARSNMDFRLGNKEHIVL